MVCVHAFLNRTRGGLFFPRQNYVLHAVGCFRKYDELRKACRKLAIGVKRPPMPNAACVAETILGSCGTQHTISLKRGVNVPDLTAMTDVYGQPTLVFGNRAIEVTVTGREDSLFSGSNNRCSNITNQFTVVRNKCRASCCRRGEAGSWKGWPGGTDLLRCHQCSAAP